STAIRVYALGAFMIGMLGVLSAKLWHEQMTNSKKWTDRLRKSSSVTVRIPSVRGEIRDRNGIILVANRSSYCVDFYLQQMVKGYGEMNSGKVPLVSFRTTRDGMLKDVEVPDIVEIVNEAVIPRFGELQLARDYAAGQLERHYRTNEQVPFGYLEDVDFNTIAKISENDMGLPGVEVSLRPVRRYLYGSLASHILGYVGAPEDINTLHDIKEFNFYQPDVQGRSNVEKVYDQWLRGKPGKRILDRSAKNKIGAELSREEPVPGANLYLTIDAEIQTIVERTLKQAGVGRAAVVVVNPQNGDVLAMASVPNYDPNIFIPKISAEDYDRLDEDPTDPLVNRAVQSFAPGSTYKIVSAFAGFLGGLAPGRTYSCAGGVTVGNKFMKCWIAEHHGAHGPLNLVGAIKNSCNSYFYQWGRDAKLINYEKIGDALGLGMRSGLPLSGESPGTLPGPRWLAAQGQSALATSWGHIANTAIGQGSVLASPLQMAMVCATVANGGTSFYPRLVAKLEDSSGKDLRDEQGNLIVPTEPNVRANLPSMGFSVSEIEAVRQGMWKVVNEAKGTGAKARIKGVEVAGKTGTAQFWRTVGKDSRGHPIREKDNHVWFMCFAPYKNPKYAICVMIQGAKSGGGVAAPVAHKILTESLALEGGYKPTIAWMEPIHGNLTQISEIKMKEDGSLSTLVATTFKDTDQKPGGNVASVDEETSDHTGTPNQASGAREKSGAKPELRETADARGRVSAGSAKPNLWQRIFSSGKSKPSPSSTQIPSPHR
ncbi:MAG: penicillin-binding transpeptidase domain-containing protein, partial [Chthoniobacteraceae bacterium]